MKRISPRTILFCSAPSPWRYFYLYYSTRIPGFSTSSNAPFTSSSSLPSPRRQDEESRNVRVSVWWDFENCNIPAGANVFKVAQSITAAIRVNGIKGPIQITAFGDVLQLSRSNQEALSSTGINLTHIPRGHFLSLNFPFNFPFIKFIQI